MDVTQSIHMIVTAVTSVAAAALAYYKFKGDKVKQDAKDDNVCQKEFQDLKTKVAVLEERLENEIEMINKIEGKVDHILEQI